MIERNKFFKLNCLRDLKFLKFLFPGEGGNRGSHLFSGTTDNISLRNMLKFKEELIHNI